MRYWKFDVCQLIRDYKSNRRTLTAIEENLYAARKFYEHPMGAENKGDWEKYIEVLELRHAEYQMYVDMVTLGLQDLPEVERLVLKWWLVDGWEDSAIVEHGGIKNNNELQRIKKIALTKFTNIVMPN